LGDIADARGDQLAWRAIGDVAVLEENAPGLHREHAERRLEGRGLAGTVGADDGGDSAPRHAERQAIEDRHLAVAGDDVLQAQDILSGQDMPRSPWGSDAPARDRPRR